MMLMDAMMMRPRPASFAYVVVVLPSLGAAAAAEGLLHFRLRLLVAQAVAQIALQRLRPASLARSAKVPG